MAAHIPVRPRIILHGGAGNITPDNLPPASYTVYQHALLTILRRAVQLLQKPDASAIDVAAYAVRLLEENPLFNAGHGAVFTREGRHELEASIMVSRGLRKRGVGVINVRKTKSPITLAKEMLLRGESSDGGGAQGHCQLQGATCDQLAQEWGLDLVRPSYYWTRKRWDEHRKGLGLPYDDETYKKHRSSADDTTEHAYLHCPVVLSPADQHDHFSEQDQGWNGKDYLPQGTVGAVVLDATGTLCVATSTGGLTNKLPGRVGDTPTIGAGFFAEQWNVKQSATWPMNESPLLQPLQWLRDCLPSLPLRDAHIYSPLRRSGSPLIASTRAVAISGTGNGDSFLRLSAVRTAAAMAQFSVIPLQQAISLVAGPNGLLQESAEDRWRKTGEGEGGMIGIELDRGESHIVADFNCGGMFHAFVDDAGREVFRVFRR